MAGLLANFKGLLLSMFPCNGGEMELRRPQDGYTCRAATVQHHGRLSPYLDTLW